MKSFCYNNIYVILCLFLFLSIIVIGDIIMKDIKSKIEYIKNNIMTIAKNVERNPEDILLLGVTKTVDVNVIQEAIESGITEVGENKPQELQRKYDVIGDKVKWHQIGSLQTNKVKYIIDKVTLIHSLDRISLAEEIQKRAELCDLNIECLVQVNISGEETKHGLKKNEVEGFIRECSKRFDRIKIVGMMTMAPFDADDNEIRKVFKGLKDLSEYILTLGIKGVEMRELSMGMSQDYKIAIEEGATIVRIGTSIFGSRNK